MANTKSAQKAVRSSARKRIFNLVTRNKLKTALKSFKKALLNKSGDLATSLSASYSALDKAVKKNYIPKKRADRKKSRLAKMIAKAS